MTGGAHGGCRICRSSSHRRVRSWASVLLPGETDRNLAPLTPDVIVPGLVLAMRTGWCLKATYGCPPPAHTGTRELEYAALVSRARALTGSAREELAAHHARGQERGTCAVPGLVPTRARSLRRRRRDGGRHVDSGLCVRLASALDRLFGQVQR